MIQALQELKVGDTVVRLLAGTIPMKLVVTELTETLITTGGGWTFDRATGAEIDEYLNWGPSPLMTGSYIETDPAILVRFQN